jgi:Phage capsid protein
MAVETIDRSLVIQFSDQVHVAAQQMQSRFRPYVKIMKMQGDKFAYDGLNSVEARELSGRVQPTVFDDIEHTRREIVRRQFSVTLPIDAKDVAARLTDPTADYAKAVVAAMDRQFDRVCQQALFADVRTGRDFETTVTAVNDGVRTVNATAGLTYVRLLDIVQNAIDDDVFGNDNRKMALFISGDEHTRLMQETQLISGDFTRQMAVEGGRITKAIGMDVVTFAANARSPVLPVSGGVRNCWAMVEGGLAVGISQEMKVTVKDRPDLVNVTQLQITGTFGAVRTEGKLIQRVTTTD